MGELMNKPSNILSNTINVPHKACFLPVTVGQKSLFSPLDLFLILPPPSSYFGPSSLPLLFFYQPMPSSSSLLFSCVPFPLLLSLLNPLLPPGPAGLCGANHQTAAPLSPLTEQLPPPQQCSTLLGQSPTTVATIQDPHLANRGGGLGQGGPSGLMEGTRRVNY